MRSSSRSIRVTSLPDWEERLADAVDGAVEELARDRKFLTVATTQLDQFMEATEEKLMANSLTTTVVVTVVWED